MRLHHIVKNDVIENSIKPTRDGQFIFRKDQSADWLQTLKVPDTSFNTRTYIASS